MKLRPNRPGRNDPAFAHIPLAEEGVARWRVRFKARDERKKKSWKELGERLGLER
jgi:hypothetical protein